MSDALGNILKKETTTNNKTRKGNEKPAVLTRGRAMKNSECHGTARAIAVTGATTDEAAQVELAVLGTPAKASQAVSGSSAASRKRSCCCMTAVVVAVAFFVTLLAIGLAFAHTAKQAQRQFDNPDTFFQNGKAAVDLRPRDGKVGFQAHFPTPAPSSPYGISINDLTCELTVESRPLASLSLESPFELVSATGSQGSATQSSGRLVQASASDVRPSTIAWLGAHSMHHNATVQTKFDCDVHLDVSVLGLFQFSHRTSYSGSVDVDTSGFATDAGDALWTAIVSDRHDPTKHAQRNKRQRRPHPRHDERKPTVLDLRGLASLTVHLPKVGFDVGEPIATHHLETRAGTITCIANASSCDLDLPSAANDTEATQTSSTSAFWKFTPVHHGGPRPSTLARVFAPISRNDNGEVGLFAQATTDNTLTSLLGTEHRLVLYSPNSLSLQRSPGSRQPPPSQDEEGSWGTRRALAETPYDLCDLFVICYNLEVDSTDIGACLDMAMDWSHLYLNVTVDVDADRVFDLNAGWTQTSTDGARGTADVDILVRESLNLVFDANGSIEYEHDQSSASLVLDWTDHYAFIADVTGSFSLDYTLDATVHPQPATLGVMWTNNNTQEVATIDAAGDIYWWTLGDLLGLAMPVIIEDFPVPGVRGTARFMEDKGNGRGAVDVFVKKVHVLTLEEDPSTGLTELLDFDFTSNETYFGVGGSLEFSTFSELYASFSGNMATKEVQLSLYDDGQEALFFRRLLDTSQSPPHARYDSVILSPGHYAVWANASRLPRELVTPAPDSSSSIDYDALEAWSAAFVENCDHCDWTPGFSGFGANSDRTTELELMASALSFAKLPLVIDLFIEDAISSGEATCFWMDRFSFARAVAGAETPSAFDGLVSANSRLPHITSSPALDWENSWLNITSSLSDPGTAMNADVVGTLLLARDFHGSSPVGVRAHVDVGMDVHADSFLANTAFSDVAADVFMFWNLTDVEASLLGSPGWTPPPDTVKVGTDVRHETNEFDYALGLAGGFLCHGIGMAGLVAGGFPEGEMSSTSTLVVIDMDPWGSAVRGTGAMAYTSHSAISGSDHLTIDGMVNITMLHNTSDGADLTYGLTVHVADADAALADVCGENIDFDFSMAVLAVEGDPATPTVNLTVEAMTDFCDTSGTGAGSNAVRFLSTVLHINGEGDFVGGGGGEGGPAVVVVSNSSRRVLRDVVHTGANLLDFDLSIDLTSSSMADTAAGEPLLAASQAHLFLGSERVMNISGDSLVELGFGNNAGGFGTSHSISVTSALFEDQTLKLDVAAFNMFRDDELVTLHVPSAAIGSTLLAALSVEQTLSCSEFCSCAPNCSTAQLLTPGPRGSKTAYGLGGFSALLDVNISTYVDDPVEILVDMPISWSTPMSGAENSVLLVGGDSTPWLVFNHTPALNGEWTTVVTSTGPGATVSNDVLFQATSDLTILLLQAGERIDLNATVDKEQTVVNPGAGGNVFLTTLLGTTMDIGNTSSAEVFVNLTGEHRFWPEGAGFRSTHSITTDQATAVEIHSLNVFTGPDVFVLHGELVGEGSLRVHLKLAGPLGFYLAHGVDAVAGLLDWLLHDTFFGHDYASLLAAEGYDDWSAHGIRLMVVGGGDIGSTDAQFMWAFVEDSAELGFNVTQVRESDGLESFAGALAATAWDEGSLESQLHKGLDVNVTVALRAENDASYDGDQVLFSFDAVSGASLRSSEGEVADDDGVFRRRSVHHTLDVSQQRAICSDDFDAYNWTMANYYGHYSWMGCSSRGCEVQDWDAFNEPGEPMWYTRCCQCGGGVVNTIDDVVVVGSGSLSDAATRFEETALLDYEVEAAMSDGSDLVARLLGSYELDHWTGEAVTDVNLTVHSNVSLLNQSFTLITCSDGEADACAEYGGDADRDYICDDDDSCPSSADNDEDSDDLCGDVDSCPDDATNDADNDGQCYSVDPCPDDAENDADGDMICGDEDQCAYDAENDADSDGLCGDADDCPYDAGNDADHDAICDNLDSCPGDSFGDIDSDGVCHLSDPCPFEAGVTECTIQGCPAQTGGDVDSDGICGSVDACPANEENDADSDNLCEDVDSCPTDSANDSDEDGLCNAVDSCPRDAENDIDNDSICGNVDACPYDGSNDADSDNLCANIDVCPTDSENDADSDGLCSDVDTCPTDAGNDADSDGICASADECPNDADNDADGDNVCADLDPCPDDATDLCEVQVGSSSSVSMCFAAAFAALVAGLVH